MIKFKVGPSEIGIAAVALLVAGVVGYQFVDIKSSQDGALASTDQSEDAKQEAEVEATEQKSKEVDVPEPQPAEKEINEQESQSSDDQAESEEVESEDIGVAASATQSGNIINATATFSRPAAGTCYMKFEKSGYEMEPKLVTVSNATSCTVSLSKTDFAAKGSWDMHVKFISLDKALEGESETKVVIN